MNPDHFDFAVVDGVWRCHACLLVLWLTGHPVQDCGVEICGETVLDDTRNEVEPWENEHAAVLAREFAHRLPGCGWPNCGCPWFGPCGDVAFDGARAEVDAILPSRAASDEERRGG